MISMGEKIAWGSDSNAMYEAADIIEKAARLLEQAQYHLGNMALPDTSAFGVFEDIHSFLHELEDGE
jgi:hypothetical protein